MHYNNSLDIVYSSGNTFATAALRYYPNLSCNPNYSLGYTFHTENKCTISVRSLALWIKLSKRLLHDETTSKHHRTGCKNTRGWMKIRGLSLIVRVRLFKLNTLWNCRTKLELSHCVSNGTAMFRSPKNRNETATFCITENWYAPFHKLVSRHCSRSRWTFYDSFKKIQCVCSLLQKDLPFRLKRPTHITHTAEVFDATNNNVYDFGRCAECACT